MSRKLSCPNCGGEHSLVNPGITMLVCNYCKTIVYWGADQALQMGKKSILPEADTRLFMQATGQLEGRGFQVVGHLRYEYGRGNWDEWYLQMDDGGVAWVSEDERELSLESAAQLDSTLPPFGKLHVGTPIALGGAAFTVRELGQAKCIGSEGQLPFTILPDETYPYADIVSANGRQFATLEYDEQDHPSCFVGHVLDHEQLQLADEKLPSAAAAKQGRHIKCTNCAAPIEVPADRKVETQVCEFCGAQLDLTGDEQRILGVNPEDFDPQFSFEIGQRGTFNGKPYEVAGRMLYEDDESYRTREYLLYNADAGYLWLAEENDQYVLNQPTQEAPARDPFLLSTGQAVAIGPTRFRFFEQGWSNLVFVDGALPWLATVGDRFRYADLIAPPQMFSVEMDGKEVEYFHGRYMTADDVWRAFELPGSPPKSWQVHPARPFVRGPVAKLLMLSGGIFALVNLALLAWSFGHDGREVFEQSFSADQYLKETISKPFDLPPTNIVSLQISAPLSNSWLATDIAFLDDNDLVVAEMDNAVEYYYGVEGGESWTEGSRTNTNYFKGPPPGRYRLILKGSGGSGNVGAPRGEPMLLRVRAGMVLSRYFVVAAALTLLFPLFEALRKRLFEKRRWAPVTEDDDD